MIQDYLAELSKISLLSRSEERLLWTKFKVENSREARQRIIESYQPLVYKIASRITCHEELIFDLIQEGTVGLIESVENYNYEFGVRFSTFASRRIRGRMIDYLKRLRSYQDALEVAVYEDAVEDFLAQFADKQVNVEEEVTAGIINEQVNQAISRLNPKEQKVIYDLYLLDKEPSATAQEMNISLSYFYKLQKKALQRLRGMLSKLRAEIKAKS
ncbi:MAG: sigma-70 family RNA polymerase sigma factor [Firmicutes bacterium]|nr:sigma-70 family RNA polymerase sigma factor [Bacillota bacterium]